MLKGEEAPRRHTGSLLLPCCGEFLCHVVLEMEINQILDDICKGNQFWLQKSVWCLARATVERTDTHLSSNLFSDVFECQWCFMCLYVVTSNDICPEKFNQEKECFCFCLPNCTNFAQLYLLAGFRLHDISPIIARPDRRREQKRGIVCLHSCSRESLPSIKSCRSCTTASYDWSRTNVWCVASLSKNISCSLNPATVTCTSLSIQHNYLSYHII